MWRDSHPLAPIPATHSAPNYARWESGTGSGVPTWEVGYLTPKESFIGLVQTRQSNPTWLLQQTKNAPVTGTRNAGGRDWELRDTGKGEKSMVLARPRHHRHPDRIRARWTSSPPWPPPS